MPATGRMSLLFHATCPAPSAFLMLLARCSRLRPVALLFLLAALLLGAPRPAAAQLLADTTVTWQSYARDGTTRARLYATPSGEKRDRVVVLTELAENDGPSAVEELRHLAELIGRRYDFDPASAYFVVHWGAHSYEGADPDDERELLLRAGFHRTSTGNLSSPNWYLLSREQLRELTDRQFSD